MNTWHGHQLITRATLEEIQLRGARSAGERASHQGRALVAGARFWEAAACRRLADYLRPAAISTMQNAEWAFTELWAFRAANVVYRGLEAMLDRPTVGTLPFVAAAVEDELSALAVEIDKSLADYATELALLHAPAMPPSCRDEHHVYY
jgi:hypothetical protein